MDMIGFDDVVSPTAQSSSQKVDLVPWLARATLDVIGLAGFLYSFGSLSASKGSPNELSEAFALMARRAETVGLWTILTTFIPILRIIVCAFHPSRRTIEQISCVKPVKQERDFARAKGVMQRVGAQLVAERKAHILATRSASFPSFSHYVLN